MLYNSKIVKPALLAQFEAAYKAMMTNRKVDMLSLATQIRSDKPSENYAWLGDLPVVREWVGDKQLPGLKDYGYQIKNKDWYTGFSVDRNEIEDEQIDAIMPRSEFAAIELIEHGGDLISNLIKNGDSLLAYDGSAFFANRSVNDNLLGGTGVSTSQIETDIATVRAAMMRFKSDTGKEMNLAVDTIVCPPELETTFLKVVESTAVVTAGGVTLNPTGRWIKNVIADPYLTDTNDWYAFCTSMPLKPFIFQVRKNPIVVIDDTQVHKNRKIEFSAEMRGNVGYGFPQMGIKVVNT